MRNFRNEATLRVSFSPLSLSLSLSLSCAWCFRILVKLRPYCQSASLRERERERERGSETSLLLSPHSFGKQFISLRGSYFFSSRASAAWVLIYRICARRTASSCVRRDAFPVRSKPFLTGGVLALSGVTRVRILIALMGCREFVDLL